MKKLLILSVFTLLIIGSVVGSTPKHAEARARYGSHRVGGYTSHGKGSHYIGGYVRSGPASRYR